MGLLDGLNSEEGQIGLGLLAAAGPRFDGAGWGQRLMEGLSQGQKWKQQQQEQEFRQMQMENLKSEIASRALAQAREAKLQSFIEERLGGSGGSGAGLTTGGNTDMGGGQGLSVGGVSARPVSPSAIPANANPGGLANMSVDDLARLKLLGKDLTDVYKLTQPNLQSVNGVMIDTKDPRNTNRFIADPTKSIDFDPVTKKVSLLPNALEVQTALAGIPEKVKADYDLVDVPMGDGTTKKMSRSDAVTMLRGQGTPSIPSVGQRQPTQQEMALILADAKKNGISNPFINLANNTEFGRTVSPEEQARRTKQAEVDVKPTDARQNSIASANYLVDTIDKALKHPGLSTGTGLSGTLDPRNYIPGTEATNFKVVVDQLKGSGFLQAYENLRGSGAITEVEGKKATDAIARMNTSQSTNAFTEALNDFKGVVNNGISRMNDSANRAGVVVDQSNTGGKREDQKPANLLNELPKTARVGSRARDTQTGQVMVFDGLKWKPE